MSATWAGVIIFVFVPIFLIWLAAIVILLSIRRTRKAGVVVLAIPAILFGLMIFGRVFSQLRRINRPATATVAPPILTASAHAETQTTFVAVEKPPEARNPALSHEERGSEASAMPDWLRSEPKLVGDAYRMTLAGGPYTTLHECEENLPGEIQKALAGYVRDYLGVEVPDDLRSLFRDPAFQKNIVKERWEEIREHSVGPMTTLHVRLEIDRKSKDCIEAAHRRAVVERRLMLAGASLAAVLLILAAWRGHLQRGRPRDANENPIAGG